VTARVPAFESVVLVTDNPPLAAKVSALFTRPDRYFPVIDGPRMGRLDAENEVVRQRNAMVMTGATQALIGGDLPAGAIAALGASWKSRTISERYEDFVEALRGSVKRPGDSLSWGPDNLGIGLYAARLAHKGLELELATSPQTDLLEVGHHLLIACERGNQLGEVQASNLAFASGASLAMIPELAEDDRDDWLEELYALGEGGDVTGRFGDLARRAREHFAHLDFTRYKAVLFVTGGFPWGVALPALPTTHMYRYPDFGRAVVEGLWASQTARRSARTALIVDPETVKSSEILPIRDALLANKTLTHVVIGPAATQVRVQSVLDLLPYDIVVLSSHAGDAPGARITYEYPDAEGRQRRLVVDRAQGIGRDSADDMYRVMEYHRFHSLDGVDWRDRVAKARLGVGSAITTWLTLAETKSRSEYIVDEQAIPRVIGSMAIRLHDGIWLFASHGFAPESAPLFFNNSCSSWHRLSQRTIFAGARGYVGTLFPITDAEAQEVGKAIFGRYLGHQLHRALWRAQRDTYGTSARRPYVMVGLPFVAVCPNTVDSVSYLTRAYVVGIAHWKRRASESPHEDVRQNARRYESFLREHLEEFRGGLRGRPPKFDRAKPR
jgi:hypothetical protein